MTFYQNQPVIETFYARGERLRRGCDSAIRSHRLEDYVQLMGRDCNLLFGTRDAERRPSQPLRTLLMQEMIKRGILAPSFVVSYSHSESDIDRTLEAFDAALGVYRRALEDGVERWLDGPSVKPVFRRYA